MGLATATAQLTSTEYVGRRWGKSSHPLPGSTGLEMPVALVPNGCQTLLSACDSLAIPSLPFCDQLALLAVLDFANSETSGSPPGPASWPLSCPGPLPAALEAVNHSCSIGGSGGMRPAGS